MQLLLTVPQALGALQISRATFYRLVTQGELTLIKIGRGSRVAASEVEAFILKGGAR